MESAMVEGRLGNNLATSLLRVASDPASIGSLYKVLGGFCHECRNVLNGIKLSFYLAKRESDPAARASLGELEPHYLAVERLVDRLQMICRPMAPTPVKLPLGLLIEERRGHWEAWMGTNRRPLEMFPPKRPAIGEFDPNLLGQGLDALVSWRAEVGAPGEPARLGWGAEEQEFRLDWEEPSALGLDPAERAESLALPLLGRIIAAHGGRLDWSARDGLHVGLRWSLAVPKTSCESTPC